MEELRSLEEELEKMLHEDDDYWVRNDAKFRAVEQTSTYEEFQNFVKEKTRLTKTENGKLTTSNSYV